MRRVLSKGSGMVVVLAFVVLLIVGVMNLASMHLSGQVLTTVERAIVGARLQYLAECASEEAFHRLQGAANDPTDGSFAAGAPYSLLRPPAPSNAGDVTPTGLSATDSVLGTLGAGYTYDVSAEYDFQAPTATGTHDHDMRGTIHICARSAFDPLAHGPFAGLTGGLRRQVDVYRDFKVGLISPPPRFGAFTVVVNDATGLVPSDSNENIARAYWLVRKVYEDMRYVAREAQRDRCRVGYSARDAFRKIKDDSGPLLSLLPKAPYRWEDPFQSTGPTVFPTPVTEGSGGPHYFGDPTVHGDPMGPVDDMNEILLLIHPRWTPTLDLERLDIAGRVGPLVSAMETAWANYHSTWCSVWADNRLHEDHEWPHLEPLVYTVADTARAVLREYHAFQTLVGESQAELKDEWTQDYLPMLSLNAWRERAFFQVSSQAGFDAFKGQLPLSGVVLVKNAGSSITVELPDFEGKLVVVFEGPVRLEECTVKDPTKDQLTFVCFGSTMEVAGPVVHASLILGDTNPTLITDSGVLITGHLVAAGQLLCSAGSLSGTLEWDGRLECRSNPPQPAVKRDRFVVAISPPIRAKNVRRSW